VPHGRSEKLSGPDTLASGIVPPFEVLIRTCELDPNGAPARIERHGTGVGVDRALILPRGHVLVALSDEAGLIRSSRSARHRQEHKQ
jgi:hypothetical protein